MLREQNQNIRDAYLASLERDDFLTQEVERLRELLERAIEIAREYQKHACKNINEDCDWSMQGTHQKFNELCDELARLAPAPEEPIAVNSEPTNLFVDQKTQNVSDNDWRELGPDEIPQIGDQWYDGKPFGWVGIEYSTNEPASRFTLPFRTRRPLPKPKLTRASYDEDWNLKLKQEEIPLEGDIENLEEIASSVPHGVATQRIAEKTANALRYLRDEIQKLKQK